MLANSWYLVDCQTNLTFTFLQHVLSTILNRGWKHFAGSCRYMCDLFVITNHQKMLQTVNNVYLTYFRTKLGHWEKSWAPHISIRRLKPLHVFKRRWRLVVMLLFSLYLWRHRYLIVSYNINKRCTEQTPPPILPYSPYWKNYTTNIVIFLLCNLVECDLYVNLYIKLI